MTPTPTFTLIAAAGTAEGDAFVGRLSDGAVRLGYRAVRCVTFPCPPAPIADLADRADRLTPAELEDAVRRTLATEPPAEPDLHVMALTGGYASLRFRSLAGRRFVTKRHPSAIGDNLVAASADIVALANAAADAGLRVRFN